MELKMYSIGLGSPPPASAMPERFSESSVSGELGFCEGCGGVADPIYLIMGHDIDGNHILVHAECAMITVGFVECNCDPSK